MFITVKSLLFYCFSLFSNDKIGVSGTGVPSSTALGSSNSIDLSELCEIFAINFFDEIDKV